MLPAWRGQVEFNPKTEVDRTREMVGTARCAVLARVQRAERTVQNSEFTRLRFRVTAQRAVPTNFGFRVQNPTCTRLTSCRSLRKRFRRRDRFLCHLPSPEL